MNFGPACEAVVLQRAGELDSYALEDALRWSWLPETAHSEQMARLRLRLARDPHINDRLNANDDDELCALLERGLGLTELNLDDLRRAALELGPDYPLQPAEFAEVAWREGRPEDAAAVMRAVVETIPPEPAYGERRGLAQLIVDAAAFDAAEPSGATKAALRLEGSLAVVPDANDLRRELRGQAQARLDVRRLLVGGRDGGPTQRQPSPDSIRARADRLAPAGAASSRPLNG